LYIALSHRAFSAFNLHGAAPISFRPDNTPLNRKPLSGVATPRSARRLRKQTT
jgi:hypothetical protein